MSERVQDRITIDELERLVRERDSSALLVAPRILRRVIARERGISFLALQLSHYKSYTVPGTVLKEIAEANEVGLAVKPVWPTTAILVAQPEAEELAQRSRDKVLVEYWRLLFRARVRLEIERRLVEERSLPSALARRIAAIGRAEFAEAEVVLRHDGHMLAPRSELETYSAFAAVFLDLRSFSPALIHHVFPAIEDPEAVESVLAADVDRGSVLAATQLAPDPDLRESAEIVEQLLDEESEDDPSPSEPSHATSGSERWLIRKAEKVAAQGNAVRSAILWIQAAGRVGPVSGRRARLAARGEIERLSRRLQNALGFDEVELDRWRHALFPLLQRASQGFWKPEARLLYDLQKVCNDHEREVFTVDVIEWIRSLGRRPIKRSLPHLQSVLILQHLRVATARLPSTRLRAEARSRLERLIRPASALTEETVRSRFRPIFRATLVKAGFEPRNLPEQVALDKLIEELLDRIVSRGYATIGDLRDACSRSQLKMPDLARPSDLLTGNRLLRADTALAMSLDGVYRRGEIYLRGLQRFSAIAFATGPGRFATLYGVLPFGGTFVALEGIKHLLALFGPELELVRPWTMLVLGSMALALINFRAARRHFLSLLRTIGRALRAAFVRFPNWVARLPVVRRIVESRIFVFLWRYLLKPLLVLAPFWFIVRQSNVVRSGGVLLAGAAFAAMSVLLNSRVGRDVEEILAEAVARLWRRLWVDFFPGMFRLIVWTFQRFIEFVERILYAVDEWLRFRAGQKRASLVAKGALGFVWFFIAYIVRFYVNLLIEPQVNPIKHFPVVTVSHKVILPMSKTLIGLLAAPLMPLGKFAAFTLASTTVLLLPGIFGFLVWEFKENWRLYEANRSRSLRPVLVGSHGETLVRLLRPGFHSGTLPKLFAKLRRAELLALEGSRHRGVLKYRESLHHVELDVRRFIDREFLSILGLSRTVGPLRLNSGELALATNRIRVEFHAAERPESSFQIVFEEGSHGLRGELSWPRTPAELPDGQRQTLVLALVGLYKLSGVEEARLAELAGVEGTAIPSLFTRDEATLSGDDSTSFRSLAITWERWISAWSREQTWGEAPATRDEADPVSQARA